MRIEFAVDCAGLSWSGLEVSLYVAKEPRAQGEASVWMQRPAPGSRSFRVGGLEGTISASPTPDDARRPPPRQLNTGRRGGPSFVWG